MSVRNPHVWQLLCVLAVAFYLCGCKPQPSPQPQPGPSPQPSTVTDVPSDVVEEVPEDEAVVETREAHPNDTGMHVDMREVRAIADDAHVVAMSRGHAASLPRTSSTTS